MLIIACGNRDRADDAAGILVAERLRVLGVDAKTSSGDVPDLMEAWSTSDDVIVVDCIVSGAAPGTVHVWDASRPLASQFSGSTHGLGVGEAIELARAMGCLPARLRVYGIEGKNFEIGGAVSAEVSHGIAEVVTRIVGEPQKEE